MKSAMSIGEFAKLTGVSQRTLRYYDQIGLMKPSHISESGRRYYTERDLIPLQHIIALKYLEYPLEEIRIALPQTTASLKQSLALQKQAIVSKQEHLAQMLKAVDYSLSVLEMNEEPDTQFITFLIHSVIREKEHLHWMSRHFPQQSVDFLTETMKTRELEITRSTAELMQQIKRDLPLFEPGHPRLQEYADKVLNMVKETLGPDFHMEAINPDAFNDVPDLHVSPFTAEEELKLGEVFKIYAERQNGEE